MNDRAKQIESTELYPRKGNRYPQRLPKKQLNTAEERKIFELFQLANRNHIAYICIHYDYTSACKHVGIGALQREVKLLSDAGIIRRTVRGEQVYYRANPDSGNT